MTSPVDHESPKDDPPADDAWLNHRLDSTQSRTLRWMWRIMLIAAALALLTILGFYGDVFRRLIWQ